MAGDLNVASMCSVNDSHPSTITPSAVSPATRAIDLQALDFCEAACNFV